MIEHEWFYLGSANYWKCFCCGKVDATGADKSKCNGETQ